MIQSPYEQLLKKFLENDCTPEESKVVLDWLKTPEGQEFAAKNLDEDILKTNDRDFAAGIPVRSSIIYSKINNELSSGTSKRISEKQTNSRNWLKIAAAIFIPLLAINLLVWLLWQQPDTKEVVWKEVYVPKGEKLQIMFQDGSKVWLNADTKLTYPVNFEEDLRSVTLEGEAYFAVEKNPSKPFLVNAGDLTVRVTGTSFNVKAYKEENFLTTTLDEGKVSVLLNGNKEYKLEPGQQAQYNKTQKQLSVSAIANSGAEWRANKIAFKDTPLPEVIKVLERSYNVKFIIKDQELMKYTYTISFQNESLENVLTGLEKITPIKCNMKDGKVEVTKRTK